MVTLTATATSTIRSSIIDSLHMETCAFVTENTDRPNIRYSVVHTKEDIKSIFSWLIDEVRQRGVDAPRALVFCQRKSDCTDLYGTFKKELKHDMYHTPNGEPQDDRTSLVGMYHHGTLEAQKETAISSFTTSDVTLMRILFCTSSFGLGVHVRQCHLVIHLGPPKKLDHFIQESGRVGRDGAPSKSITLVLPGCLKGGSVEPETRLFVNGKDVCRRKILMHGIENENFQPLDIPHTCCDVCASTCRCLCKCDDTALCSCLEVCIRPHMYLSAAESNLYDKAKRQQRQITELPVVFDIDQDDRYLLELNLVDMRQRVQAECKMTDMPMKADITTGFILDLIQDVVSKVEHISSPHILMVYFPFFNQSPACEVYDCIQKKTICLQNSPG